MVDVKARIQEARRELARSGASPYTLLHQLQGGRCFFCSRTMRAAPYHHETCPDGYTRDHLRPRSRGGVAKWNTVLACAACNHAKGSRLPSRSDLRLAPMLWSIFAPVAGWYPAG